MIFLAGRGSVLADLASGGRHLNGVVALLFAVVVVAVIGAAITQVIVKGRRRK
jgi:predicted Co/Zn/Cd cation transporter (cation efflux family)